MNKRLQQTENPQTVSFLPNSVCSIRCFDVLHTSGVQLCSLLYTTTTWGEQPWIHTPSSSPTSCVDDGWRMAQWNLSSTHPLQSPFSGPASFRCQIYRVQSSSGNLHLKAVRLTCLMLAICCKVYLHFECIKMLKSKSSKFQGTLRTKYIKISPL